MGRLRGVCVCVCVEVSIKLADMWNSEALDNTSSNTSWLEVRKNETLNPLENEMFFEWILTFSDLLLATSLALLIDRRVMLSVFFFCFLHIFIYIFIPSFTFFSHFYVTCIHRKEMLLFQVHCVAYNPVPWQTVGMEPHYMNILFTLNR